MIQIKTVQSETVTIRVDAQVKARLEKAALNQNRSKSFLVGEAIAGYLAIQEEQDRIVRLAIESADRGETIPHEEIKKWVDSWGTKDELPMPKV